MRNWTPFLFVCIALCLAASLQAQSKDDSRYLAGAVPEVDGKVVFSKEFSIPGMGQDEVYDRVHAWMLARLGRNKNESRVVFADKERGQIVGVGDEWMVFSSSALSLDRTKVMYQLTALCSPEKCTLEIGRMRFSYREGKEKYTAEEWITDRYALNKAKTKLVWGLAKWRRKTVDFVDSLGISAAEALSAATADEASAEKKREEKKPQAPVSGPIVIIPKREVVTEPQGRDVTEPRSPNGTKPRIVDGADTGTSAATDQSQGYRDVPPGELPPEVIRSEAGRLVIVIGDDPFNQTILTAESGGSLGKVDGKSVVFSILSPGQPNGQMEKAERYTVRFYPVGKEEASVILECRRLPTPTAVEGMPRTYVGKILRAKMK